MGPLAGLKVIEVASVGPGPFCAMLLSDMGADVLRIDRATEVGVPGARENPELLFKRGRRSVAVDLKHPGGAATVLRLVEGADVLIEGFRPGVAERLGFGPEPCLERNPGIVYGRMTGWGQSGPGSRQAGHDLNYLAVTGAALAIGASDGPPIPPLNLVGDFGGGAMLLAVGILAALHERRTSGAGQVVDASMADGAAQLATMFYAMRDLGMWSDERGTNLLDGGAPFYATYETADAKYVSVCAMEPQFYAGLVEAMGLAGADLPPQNDTATWPAVKATFASVFAGRTREEWCEVMAGHDVCFTPVLSFDEARVHPENVARGRFVENDGFVQPAPAPRFDRTPSAIAGPAPLAGEHSREALVSWGMAEQEVEALLADGAVLQAG
jgi:alpha-methylacyl-CoA racemase